MADLLTKMFGKAKKEEKKEERREPGVFGKLVGKVKEIRESNIERRERIARVRRAAKEKEHGMTKKELDAEAVRVSKELGVSYEDAFEYVKSERKSAARKKTLQKVAGTLSEVGARAREQTKRTMHKTTVGKEETFKPRSPFESSFGHMRAPKRGDPFKPHMDLYRKRH